MKFNKFAAPFISGVLTLSLGLAACGGATSTAASTATSEATSAATSAVTSEATSAATSAAADATTAAEDKVLFWQGESDKGDALLYAEDEENDTSCVILFGSHDDQDELLAFNGPVTQDGNAITITDSETGDAFTFTITGVTEDALTIDLGDHGTGTLSPVTEKQFEETVDEILNAIKEIGEELMTLDEQDFEELSIILEAIINEAGAAEATTSAA